jgi:hypothetical protein
VPVGGRAGDQFRNAGLLPVGLLLGLSAGCAGGEVRENAGGTQCQQQALYHAAEAPALLALPRSQQAAIGRVTSEGAPPGFFCTGTRVPGGWVLTAAHCRFGAMTFHLQDGGAEEALEGTEVAVHPSQDLMLFRIAPPRTTSWRIPVVVDAAAVDLAPADAVLLAGLGEREDGGAGQRRFLAATIHQVTEQTIVVDGRGRNGACFGDSGGPMLIRDWTGQVALVGVLSKGSPSCLALDLAVRTDAAGEWLASRLAVAAGDQPPPDQCAELPATGLCYRGQNIRCEGGQVISD